VPDGTSAIACAAAAWLSAPTWTQRAVLLIFGVAEDLLHEVEQHLGAFEDVGAGLACCSAASPRR